jgi:hypothetical protein
VTPDQDSRTAADALQAEVAFLLEDVPDSGVDWRYRVRVADGRSSGWVEVQGTGEPLDPQDARALVLACSRDLPSDGRVPLLEAMSPLVSRADQ